MKRYILAGFFVGVWLAVPLQEAEAADNVACAVTTSTSTAATTAAPASGACDWQPGNVIMMQCTTDVYVDTNAVRAVFNTQSDGGNYFDGGTTGGVATSADQRVDFSSNSDPYIIYLNNGDHHVSLLAVSAAGSCKFMKTQRARPWR